MHRKTDIGPTVRSGTKETFCITCYSCDIAAISAILDRLVPHDDGESASMLG